MPQPTPAARRRKKVESVKKYNVVLIACALLALALCLTPARAFANETGHALQVEQDEKCIESAPVEKEGAEIAVSELTEQSGEAQAGEALVNEAQAGTGNAPVVVQSGEQIKDVSAGKASGGVTVGEVTPAMPVVNRIENNPKMTSMYKRITGYWLEGALATHYVGDDLNCAGLVWAIRYEDGSVERMPVDPDAVNGYDKNKAGMQGLGLCQAHESGLFMALTMVTVKERPTSMRPVVLNKPQSAEIVLGSGKRFEAASGVYVQLEARYQWLDRSLPPQGELTQGIVATDPQLEARYQTDAQAIGRVSCEAFRAPAIIDLGAKKLPIGSTLCDGLFVNRATQNLYAYPLSENAYELLASAS